MDRAAIQVEVLGKRYRIGQLAERHDTLRDALADLALAPVRRLRALRRSDGANDFIWALKDLDFTVQPGEVVGVIGRNGAGKSTLLKVLSRITEPTEGRAWIRGRVGSLLEVGTGFHPELTGRENIYLNGAILGMRRDEIAAKFDQIVAFSGVEKFIDTPVKRYSSGMYLRLAFAVAAHLQTDILLVDEVLAVGDAEFQKKCLGKMGDIAGEGRTVLLVSHHMNAVQGLCQRVIVLDGGRVAFDGPTAEGIAFYLSSYRTEGDSLPLAERTDRRGTGVFRFQEVRFLDGETQTPLNLLISGQRVLVEVRYKNLSDRPLGPVHVGISFWSATGQFMFACNNEAVTGLYENLPDEGTLTCVIPRWPLSSGLYTFNLFSKESGLVSDHIRPAGSIQVERGDFYGTGKLPAQTYQGVFIDYEWRTT